MSNPVKDESIYKPCTRKLCVINQLSINTKHVTVLRQCTWNHLSEYEIVQIVVVGCCEFDAVEIFLKIPFVVLIGVAWQMSYMTANIGNVCVCVLPDSSS